MYPGFLIMLGALIRCFFSGCNFEELEKFSYDSVRNDVINFIVSIVTLTLIYLTIVFFIKM
jgi:hypothetical protein